MTESISTSGVVSAMIRLTADGLCRAGGEVQRSAVIDEVHPSVLRAGRAGDRVC